MGLDFVRASTGGMEPDLAHITLESQFRFPLLPTNDAFFIIEVFWIQIVMSDNYSPHCLKLLKYKIPIDSIDDLVARNVVENKIITTAGVLESILSGAACGIKLIDATFSESFQYFRCANGIVLDICSSVA
ncbi:hypothetical protein AVEN_171414-1 [Araneus ventricosus]|uniref:Uncharacterized protein n=1 Tax=Araneus ventricosus TaxID=182803 RepID=A0A4Y2D5T1_ARAVE|nr:hypothetical protein AVEN_171414-1 [Araneus ventricosus]